MRIAIDCRKFDDFGIGSYIRGLVGAFAGLGGDDEFLLLAPREAASVLPSSGRFTIVEENSPRYSLRELTALRRRIDALHVDVFHAPHYVVPRLEVPTVVTIHDLIHLRLPGIANVHKRLYARWMIGRAAAADAVIAVSHAAGDDIVRHFSAAAGRIQVIPNGVGSEFFSTLAAPDGEYFLYVGNDKPHKNLAGLVSAFSSYREQGGRGGLVLVGAAAARFSGMSGVRLAGRVSTEELAKLYRGAIALVMPSFAEGFGLPVAEAMASGTAVICSQIEALVEVSAGGALLVNPHDPSEITAAMHRLAKDPSTRSSLAARGRSAADAYRWERAARETLATYHQVGAAGSSRRDG